MKLRRWRAAAVALTAGLVAMTMVASPASAADYTWTETIFVKTTKVVPNVIDYGHPFAAHCNLPCSFNSTVSATRRIDYTLGLSFSAIAANLGISSSTTKTLGVGCTVPKKPGMNYIAVYPINKVYQFQVKVNTYDQWNNLRSTALQTKYAYDPTGYYCGATSK